MNEQGSKAVLVEPMTDAQAGALLAIYRSGIDEGNATFETQLPARGAFSAAQLPGPRFVATERRIVVGSVASAAVSGRRVYAGVVEYSVCVHPRARGRGVGRMLLDALIASSESAGIWTIQSGIFPENTASLRLRRSAGFRKIGVLERIAQHHGSWRDVVLIERQSAPI